MAKNKIERSNTATLYSYVEPANAVHAKTVGRAKFGSFSNYINWLIAKDRGDKASIRRSTETATRILSPVLVRDKVVKVKKVAKKTKAPKAKKAKATKSAPKKARKLKVVPTTVDQVA